MLYFCGDTRGAEVTGIDNAGNVIEWEMALTRLGIINELAPGSGTDLNVLILYDYPYSSNHPNGHAVIYEITPGTQTTVADWGATNMGDDATLSQFINFCKTNYPADHYGLFLADHGRGYAGICYDYHAPHPYLTYPLGDCLELPEIESALSSGNEDDIIFFDCCLGASFEIAWQICDVADYMMASETSGSPLVIHQP